MTTLREAREQGKLEEFIREREPETGDSAATERTISAMARKSSEAPKASKKGNGDG